MTIILFLVDTSGSMNQRTHFGARPTLLDVAKDAVEKFLKIRQRDAASRGDRYMLLTFEDPPSNVKAGWKESHVIFMNELKNLYATGMTSLGPALKNAFDLLNINRMQTGIDTYGQGRCPFFLEPSIIIVITDGGKLSNTAGVQEELNLPMHSLVPGSELTKEPFRWDQRLFSLVLRLTGTYNSPNDNILANTLSNNFVPFDESPINAMCEVTGGRSYCISSQRTLMSSLDQLMQKIHSGVVINFEKVGPDPTFIIPNEDEQNNESEVINNVTDLNGHNQLGNDNCTNVNNNNSDMNGNSKTSWHNTRKLIYVQRSAQKGYSVGHWPIPESFWPDLSCPSLPPRTAHPVVKFMCTNSEPTVIDNLPFDKYELEPSPLTQFILSRKQSHIAWQVFVSNSHKSYELGLPFGYLKASTSLTCVNLFVLPYNYPILLPLLDDLFKVHQGKPSREWKIQFDNYLKNMPLYYASPLKRALQRMGATPNLVPDNMENCLSYPVLNYLKRLKNSAKAEYDKLVASVGTVKPISEGTRVLNNATNMRKLNELGLLPQHPYFSHRFSHLKAEFNEFPGFVIRYRDKIGYESRAQCYRNAYDISRHELLDQIVRMRSNFLQNYTNAIKYQDDDQLHSLPISQMGNYQEYLKRLPMPLRELESTPVRQHMFGNPFKVDKRGMMMIDEADIDLVGGGGGGPSKINKRSQSESSLVGPKLKRRPGPLPKDYQQRTYNSTPPASPSPLSPSSSSSSSPSPSISISPPSSPLPLPSPSDVCDVENIKPALTNGIPFRKDPNLQSSPNCVLNNVENLNPVSSASSLSLSSSASVTIQPSQEQSPQSLVPLMASNDDTTEKADQKKDPKNVINDVIVVDDVIKNPDIEVIDDSYSITNSYSQSSSTSRTIPVRQNVPLYMPVNGRVSNCESQSYELSPSSPSPQSLPTLDLMTSETTLNHNDHNGIDNDNAPTNNKRLHLSAEELEFKRYLFKLVRRPGKNYNELLREISRFKGPLKEFLINEVIAEALRFKRRALVDILKRETF